MEFSEGLGPSEFSRIVFGLEMTVAFGSAESKDLAVVTHEHDSVAGVDRS